jgi:transposase
LRKGARIAEIARRYAITRWLIYDWRKRLRNGRLAAEETPDFASVIVEESSQRQKPAAHAFIEIVVEDVIIRAGQDAGESHLVQVIRVARVAQ